MATPIVLATPLNAIYFLGASIGKRLQQKHPGDQLRYILNGRVSRSKRFPMHFSMVFAIEIINTVEGTSRVKFGSAAIGGQIQVPDVHSFTMFQAKKSF